MPAKPPNEVLGQPLEAVNCQCGCTVKVKGQPPLSQVQCPKCGAKLVVPVKLGQFLLINRVGRGAMGEVFEARDRTLGRHVAIKVMPKSATADEQAMRNFLREARMLAALNHRNVVQIHSIGVEAGQPYLVMELVSGGRMDQYIVRDQPGDELTVLRIAADVVKGLEAASNIGLVHGDVKPANILLDDSGQAKIVDFGLARFAAKQGDGKVYGTPFYIAPEMIENKAADHRSDIYSLGASMFHALVGRPPFRAKTVKDIVRMRLLDPAPNLRSLVPHFHPKTAALLARMLDKDPAARHQTYAELTEAINDAIASLEDGSMTAELADLHEAISDVEVERSAARSGRIRGRSRPDRAAARTGRIHAASRTDRRAASRTDRRAASRTDRRAAQPLAASQSQPTGRRQNTTRLVLILVAVLVIAGVALGVVLFGGGGRKGDGPDVPPAAQRSFDETFDNSPLDPAWQAIEGGGALTGKGAYRLEDSNPQRAPAIRRSIGPGGYTFTVAVSKFQWAPRGNFFRFEVMDDDRSGLRVELYKDQGDCELEVRTLSSENGSTVHSKNVIGKTPTAVNLEIAWNDEAKHWRIAYGVNGAPAETEVKGGLVNAPTPPASAFSRYIQISADQWSQATTAMELDRISVQIISP